MPEISEKNINAFLHFGWLPRTDVPPPFPEEWIPKTTSPEETDFKKAGDILRSSVERNLKSKSEVVVPLSGGLDSRAMLAILHEQGKDITAVTIGRPGAYDYEIGKLVANKFSIKHESIDVNTVKLETSKLVSLAKEIDDWTNIIECSWNILINEKYQGMPIVSGFLGDFLAGAYSKKTYPSWEQTEQVFCIDNNVSWGKPLASNEFNPIQEMPSQPSKSAMTPYEYLVYRTRHTCSLRPTVFKKDLGYVIPFRDEAWVNYILSRDISLRHGQKFYQDILLHNWSDFFSLPTKNFKGASLASSDMSKKIHNFKARAQNKFTRTCPSLSLKLTGIDPMINYTDYHNQIKSNNNLREVVKENVFDLQKRDLIPWLNLNEINSKFFYGQNKMTYHEGVMLLVLANLEINIKASESK